jgi:putative ABC transport system permease protein
VFDLRVAQELFGKQGRIDDVLVAAKDGTSPAALRRTLHQQLGRAGLTIQTARAQDRFTLDSLKSFVSFIRVFLLAFGGIAVLVGAFTIFNSLSITVAQRSRELALLRTMGASRRQVMGSVMFESLLVGILASAVGLAAGLGLAKGLNALFVALGMDLPRTGTVFSTQTIVVGALVGIVSTLAAGLVPALRATRVAPVSAMRGDGASEATKARTSKVGIGITAIGLAILAYGMFGSGLSATNRLMSLVPGCLGLFAGVAMLSPRFVAPLASAIGRPGARIGKSAGMLARRNAMRNPGRTASTAAALMIGIALVTFVSVLGSGLKDTTTGSVHKSVKAQYVVAGADGWSPIATRIPAQVAAVPGVTSVTSVVQDQAKVGADKVAVSGVDTATIAKGFRFDWKKGDDAVASSLGRDGAIVLDDFAKDKKLSIGDRFNVQSRSGKHISLVVRGTVKSSFFNPLGMGELTVSDATFKSAFTSRKPRMTLVSGSADAKAGLEKALAAYPDVKVKTAKQFGDDAAKEIDSMLAIFYVLLALAIIVSLFGIVNTLVLSVMERTRELGMLRAVGMSKRQMRRMVRHEGIITAQIGSVLGIVVGLILGGLVTGALSSSTGMGFSVPVGSLVAFTVVAALAGVAAAVLPARRAARLNVLNALSYE